MSYSTTSMSRNMPPDFLVNFICHAEKRQLYMN